MAEIPFSVIERILQLVAPIRRQLGYLWNSSSNIEGLRNQVEKLGHVRERVQHSIDDAKRNGEEIERDVDKWLKSVDGINEDVVKIFEDEDKAKRGCFNGWCCDLKLLYQLGKVANKAMKDVAELQAEGKFEKVSYRGARPQAIEFTSVMGYEAFESRMSILKDVMEALRNPNINMIGVYGLGGVGKTLLVKEVARRAKDQKLFDKVLMAVISQTPNIRKIQEEIADMLDMNFSTETDSIRARQLCKRLEKEKNLLIILDDIWKKLDLEAVGIPCGDDQRELKIVATSRCKDVLSIDMNTQENFQLGVLLEEEAWGLFWKIASDSVEECDHLKPTAVQVAKECSGLPIAIATVANALKSKSLSIWEDALRQLRRSTQPDIRGMHDNVYSALRLSYNSLESEEAKSLFLLCTFFPEDYNILLRDLLRYAVGLGLFKGINSLKEARNRLLALVSDLKANCFLLDGIKAKSVKVHDVVRDVGISIASEDKNILILRDGLRLEEWTNEEMLEKCPAISLPYCNIHELPESLKCPRLELLLLFSNDLSLKIPANFFQSMENLKVLHLRHMNFSAESLSLHFLTNLKTLCLNHCVLQDLGIIGELKNLEILSFRNSDMRELPRQIGQLTCLRLLDLGNCGKLKVIPSNVFNRLSNLEDLSITGFVQWDTENNASLAELKQLSRLISLTIHIPDAKILPRDLLFDKLMIYHIIIGDCWRAPAYYDRTLKVKSNTSIELLSGINTLLKETENLSLDEPTGIQTVIHDLDGEGFPHLKRLDVQNSPEIIYFINTTGRVPPCAFPNLESLFLYNLINMKEICRGQLPSKSFCNLQTVKVRNCNGLKQLCSLPMAKCLFRLQELEIAQCQIMDRIVPDGQGEEDGITEVMDEFVFPQLYSLMLKDLPKLTSFYFEVETLPPIPLFSKKVTFPRLASLTLSKLPKLSQIWHAHLPLESCNLKYLKWLEVHECKSLKHLFSPSMAMGLAQLQRIDIQRCDMMEEIIVKDGGAEEESMGKIIFPLLSSILLNELRNLRNFYSGSQILECPSLKELTIKGNTKLQTFIPGPVTTDTTLDGNELREPLFNEKVRLPNLEKLVVDSIKLKKLWHNQLPDESFCALKHLQVKNCDHLLNIVPLNVMRRLQNMKSLEVRHCNGPLECIFDLEGQNIRERHAIATTQLRHLNLKKLSNLVQIWKKDSRATFPFDKLSSVDVLNCRQLRNVFTTSMAKSCLQLHNLKIKCCGLMEEIVEKEKGEGDGAKIDKIVFPRLRIVELGELSELKSFCLGIHTSEWPSLKILRVKSCYRVETFTSELRIFEKACQSGNLHSPIQQSLFLVEKIAFPALEELKLSRMPNLKELVQGQFGAESFRNLTSLAIGVCGSLKHLLPSTVAKSLVQLKCLDVYRCEMMEEIIANKKGEENDEITFSRLNILKLQYLQSLTSFSSGSISFSFPSLEEVIMMQCPKLKTFSNEILSTPKLENVQVCQNKRLWKGDLNTTIQHLFIEEYGNEGSSSMSGGLLLVDSSKDDSKECEI